MDLRERLRDSMIGILRRLNIAVGSRAGSRFRIRDGQRSRSSELIETDKMRSPNWYLTLYSIEGLRCKLVV